MAHQDIQENQDIQSSDTQVEKNLKYYTASQWQLVWWRFRRHRMAMFGGCVLLIMVVMGAFPGFFGPYNGTTRDADYVLGPPQMMKFRDANGASFRPFIHGITTSRDPVTLRKIATTDPDVRHYVHFFVAGEEYSVLGLFKSKPRDRRRWAYVRTRMCVHANAHCQGIGGRGGVGLTHTKKHARANIHTPPLRLLVDSLYDQFLGHEPVMRVCVCVCVCV